MAIPLGALATIAQNLLFGVTGLAALTDVAVDDPVVGAFAAALFGAFTTLVAAMLVYAACAEALDRIDEGEQPDALDAYRGIVPALLPIAWATLRITVVAGLLGVTVIGIPFAIVYLIRKAVTLQSIVIEELGGTSGLRRSGELVRGSELRVLAIGALVNGTVALLGPVIGVAMMFVTPASLGLINSSPRSSTCSCCPRRASSSPCSSTTSGSAPAQPGRRLPSRRQTRAPRPRRSREPVRGWEPPRRRARSRRSGSRRSASRRSRRRMRPPRVRVRPRSCTRADRRRVRSELRS